MGTSKLYDIPNLKHACQVATQDSGRCVIYSGAYFLAPQNLRSEQDVKFSSCAV
jgi:hypothetical protein